MLKDPPVRVESCSDTLPTASLAIKVGIDGTSAVGWVVVGLGVGKAVGLGVTVGGLDGRLESVGIAEGAGVGTMLGRAVGDSVGSEVGREENVGAGDAVGCSEGSPTSAQQRTS